MDSERVDTTSLNAGITRFPAEEGDDGDREAKRRKTEQRDDAMPAQTEASVDLPTEERNIATNRDRAEALKRRGNECLKSNSKSAALEAVTHFTMGLELHCSDSVLNAQLYSNRAHVRILLREFLPAVNDCKEAIALDPKNPKSYWRGAKASTHLEQLQQAVQFCDAGLKQKASDPDLTKLREACVEKIARKQNEAQPSLATDVNADDAMAVQDKIDHLGDQMRALQAVIAAKQRKRALATQTIDGLEQVPSSVKLYRSVGRCFVAQTRSTLEQSFKSMAEQSELELASLVQTCKQIGSQRDTAERELTGMVDVLRRRSEQANKHKCRVRHGDRVT